ncbi:uncharacterized protein LOC125664033 isoform X3 [Ostrea edulis]|uniref:uncharacterized protein LOC125664033 isoform X3 n=1 Tax=Ostrea edulis TaxID=37623 RepID=UPI0024AFAE94|nr:uncharacterized protein LOC125664033 isoform X3 [Ostrea edulis]
MKSIAILFTFCHLQSYFHIAESCRDEKTEKCCFNFHETENGKCEECLIGTFGVNCSGRCPLGYFGRLCNEMCVCRADECNATYGCSPETDWSTLLTSKVLIMESVSSSPPQPIPSSTWERTTFILLGSIGMLVLVGMIYCFKLRFSKTRRSVYPNCRGTHTEPSAHIGCSTTNDLDKKQVGGSQTYQDIDESVQKQVTCDNAYCFRKNSDDKYDLHPDCLENDVNSLGNGQACYPNPLPSALSVSEQKMIAPKPQGMMDTELRPYSSVKYNRSDERTVTVQTNTQYQWLLLHSAGKQEQQTRHRETFQDKASIGFSNFKGNASLAVSDRTEKKLPSLIYRDSNVSNSTACVRCKEYRECKEGGLLTHRAATDDSHGQTQDADELQSSPNEKDNVPDNYLYSTSSLRMRVHSTETVRICSNKNFEEEDQKNYWPCTTIDISKPNSDGGSLPNEKDDHAYESLNLYEDLDFTE